jgi:hypothetical protein
MTTKELKDVKSLRLNKDIRIPKADKSNCTAVFDEFKYKEKLNTLLESWVNEPLPKDRTAKVERNIQKLLYFIYCKFTIKEETDNQITYLDLKLTNKRGQIEMEVYRKSTATDVTINNTSCHPKEHKLAAFKNWIHGLLILPLNENNKKKGLIP